MNVQTNQHDSDEKDASGHAPPVSDERVYHRQRTGHAHRQGLRDSPEKYVANLAWALKNLSA